MALPTYLKRMILEDGSIPGTRKDFITPEQNARNEALRKSGPQYQRTYWDRLTTELGDGLIRGAEAAAILDQLRERAKLNPPEHR